MFRKIISWLDALWWETTVVTKVRTTYQDSQRNPAETTGFRKLTNTFSPAEMLVPYHGANVAIRIPGSVLKRPPMLRNGSLDYSVFPTYRNTPLIACYRKGSHKFASCDGTLLTRTSEVRNWTRKQAFSIFEKIEGFNKVDRFSIQCETYNLALLLHRSWLYLGYHKLDGSSVQLYQTNVGQFVHDTEVTAMSFAYARAILFTLGHAQETVDVSEEFYLATSILSLLLQNLTNR